MSKFKAAAKPFFVSLAVTAGILSIERICEIVSPWVSPFLL